MTSPATQRLRLLCRLRDAEVDGAKGRLALARARERDCETAVKTAYETYRTTLDRAESYVAQEIEKVEVTRDGASVYLALAFGAHLRRLEAASAELQHRRALARREAAEADAISAAEDYLLRRARAEAIHNRCHELDREETRRASVRTDDAIAEAVSMTSLAKRGRNGRH